MQNWPSHLPPRPASYLCSLAFLTPAEPYPGRLHCFSPLLGVQGASTPDRALYLQEQSARTRYCDSNGTTSGSTTQVVT
eukprot:scaffold88_cov387-Prasinococcus_capsulatus_cf.AAC.3